MPQAIPDLWPDNLGITTAEERTPLAVLREQARRLSFKTNQRVRGEILPDPNGNSFGYVFTLITPALPGYRYSLFRIEYGVTLYPLKIIWKEPLEATSEEQFLDLLRKVFGADETIRAINALVAHGTN